MTRLLHLAVIVVVGYDKKIAHMTQRVQVEAEDQKQTHLNWREGCKEHQFQKTMLNQITLNVIIARRNLRGGWFHCPKRKKENPSWRPKKIDGNKGTKDFQ